MTVAAIGALAPADLAATESGPTIANAPGISLKQEINRLLIADAAKAQSQKTKPPADDAGANEGVLMLAPLTVKGLREPRVTPFQETWVEHFFRTGTIVQHVGRKATTRLWMKGDRGLMLSFNF